MTSLIDMYEELEETTKEEVRRVASFSGGKDSTAMVIRLVEENWPLDEIVFFDTGWEFPQVYDHIIEVEAFLGRKITYLSPKESFEYLLTEHEVTIKAGDDRGKIRHKGNGWPSQLRRWCTREKGQTLDAYCKNTVRYIGIAADEAWRKNSLNLLQMSGTFLYPLVDWDMTEYDCLKYCYARGFKWGGLYNYFSRVSCFCCPLQPIPNLKILYQYFPEQWNKMLDWGTKIGLHNRGFIRNKKIHEYDERFRKELENEDANST